MNAKAKEIIKDIAESTTSRIKVEQKRSGEYASMVHELLASDKQDRGL